MATDPFSWARTFGATQAQAAENEKARAQQLLLNIFQEEAARQRPYAVMPAQLARAEFNRRNQLPYTINAENRQMQNNIRQRRYFNDLAFELAKKKAEAGLSPTYAGALNMNGAVAGGGPVVNADGSTTITLNGRAVKIPAPSNGDNGNKVQ